MSSLTTRMLHSDIEVPCPQCGYDFWIRWVEVVVEAAVICPACRCRIRPRDAEGGMHNAGEKIEVRYDRQRKGCSSEIPAGPTGRDP